MWVHLNLAMTLDGRVAGPDGTPVRISCTTDEARVHRCRALSDAVLVGSGTILSDDPALTARLDGVPISTQPTAVVLDRRGRTQTTAQIFTGTGTPIVLTETKPDERGFHQLARVDPTTVVEFLSRKGVRRLMVEGGPTVGRAFLEANQVDLCTVYVAPWSIGAGPTISLGPMQRLGPVRARTYGAGSLLAWHRLPSR